MALPIPTPSRGGGSSAVPSSSSGEKGLSPPTQTPGGHGRVLPVQQPQAPMLGAGKSPIKSLPGGPRQSSLEMCSRAPGLIKINYPAPDGASLSCRAVSIIIK